MASQVSLLDSTFLRIESHETPMHVAALQVFSLPDDAGPAFVADLVASFREPVPLRKPFNVVLTKSVGSTLMPATETVEAIDFEYHVRHSALPAPGGERELGDLISHLHSTPLDRNRPLWTCHVIEGLSDHQFAVYLKIHHAMTDGVNAVRLASDCLATEPDGPSRAMWQAARDRPKWEKHSPSGALRLPKVATAVGLGRGLAGLVRVNSAAEPVRLPFEAPRSILNQRVTNPRRVATQQLDLGRIRTIGQATGASVNDVFLAACGGALRRYLIDRDALPERSLIAGVPVSLRAEGQDGGNAVGYLWSDLGTNLADPMERLSAIRRSMVASKDHLMGVPAEARGAFTLTTMSMTVAAILSGQSTHLPRPPMNVTISNVPGPSDVRYLKGARLDAFYPVSLVFQGMGLNLTCVSYQGQLHTGVVGSRDTLPSLQNIAVYLGEALDELAEGVKGKVKS